jgi:DNA-binding response OmpR family regulator
MWRILSLTQDLEVEIELDALAAAGRGFFNVDHALRTKEVIAWTAAELYDVYVIDCSIKAINAFGLCNLIRSWSSDAIVIMMSGKLTDRETALEAGADLFLEQPSQTHQLRPTIEGLLDKRPAPAHTTNEGEKTRV